MQIGEVRFNTSKLLKDAFEGDPVSIERGKTREPYVTLVNSQRWAEAQRAEDILQEVLTLVLSGADAQAIHAHTAAIAKLAQAGHLQLRTASGEKAA